MLDSSLKNKILMEMALLVEDHREDLFKANKRDLADFDREDRAMYDRLIVDEDKIAEMVMSLRSVADKNDPEDVQLSSFHHQNGMKVINKTAPFGTILVIYESRPDVTIEATALSFKSGNKTLLKGGKEALKSCLALVNLWKKALEKYNVDSNMVSYLNFSREETQAYLKNPKEKIDLVVPRGGESLIAFTKEYATAPVLVSGRGNNFMYIHQEADWDMALPIIIHSKIDKISACNALDKVLIDKNLLNGEDRISQLIEKLQQKDVEVLVDNEMNNVATGNQLGEMSDAHWMEEFLSMKIGIGLVEGVDEAIKVINHYSGGHSVSIITENNDVAKKFMYEVDCAAVYHNVSTRFTDGSAFGMGAELAISTDKIHHRGPLGLEHLVTNKYYIYGNGQMRK